VRLPESLHEIFHITAAARSAQLHGHAELLVAVCERARSAGRQSDRVVQFFGIQHADEFAGEVLGIRIFPLAVTTRRKLARAPPRPETGGGCAYSRESPSPGPRAPRDAKPATARRPEDAWDRAWPSRIHRTARRSRSPSAAPRTCSQWRGRTGGSR